MMVVALAVATLAQTAVARGDTVEDKRAEANRISGQLASQAQRVMEADRRLRSSQASLVDIQESLRQAQNGVRTATLAQDAARRRLAVQAVESYMHGGSVSVLGKRLRASRDLAVYDTYLSLVSGLDRGAIENLRGAKEDLGARQAVLDGALGKARVEMSHIEGDRSSLQAAADAQRANLAKVNGDLATLVAAEQAQRQAADTARLRAASVPTPGPGPITPSAGSSPGAPAPASAPAPAPAPAPRSVAGDPFACIRQLESGNNYRAAGGGAYQFQQSTWESLGYSGKPEDAPPAVQDEAAHKLQAREGWRPWTTAPLCGLV